MPPGLADAAPGAFKGDESMRLGMISYSVTQIGQFMQNNGRL